MFHASYCFFDPFLITSRDSPVIIMICVQMIGCESYDFILSQKLVILTRKIWFVVHAAVCIDDQLKCLYRVV